MPTAAAPAEAPHSRARPARRSTTAALRRLVAVETPPATATVWWACIADAGPSSPEHSLVAVNSDRFADGTPVDMTALESRGRRPAGWLVDVRYRAADGAVVRIDAAELLTGTCPPLWFAELHHATSNIPASSLLAFSGGPFRPGAVVTPREVAAAGLRMVDNVAEVRWFNRSGIVDTVTVAPALRRRGVASLLVTSAEALRVLRGWAPLRSDGRLTDAAAAWLAAAPPWWRPRVVERTQVLPDPDTGDGPGGVAHLLA